MLEGTDIRSALKERLNNGLQNRNKLYLQYGQRLLYQNQKLFPDMFVGLYAVNEQLRCHLNHSEQSLVNLLLSFFRLIRLHAIPLGLPIAFGLPCQQRM